MAKSPIQFQKGLSLPDFFASTPRNGNAPPSLLMAPRSKRATTVH
jgi:hypothetical protein